MCVSHTKKHTQHPRQWRGGAYLGFPKEGSCVRPMVSTCAGPSLRYTIRHVTSDLWVAARCYCQWQPVDWECKKGRRKSPLGVIILVLQ